MAKIITPGRLPDQEIFRCTCRNCGTFFEFMRSESRPSQDERDGDVMFIRCPLSGCGITNSVIPSAGRHG